MDLDEKIGILWHNYISKKAESGFDDATVSYVSLVKELNIFFHAMGGSHGRALGVADRRTLGAKRTLLVRVAGIGKQFPLSWQDEQGLYLPDSINTFSDASLNRTLYFWLVALASQLEEGFSWAEGNIRATRFLLERYSGFRKPYYRMRDALLQQRGALTDLQDEKTISTILNETAWVGGAAINYGGCQFVPLWLYPPSYHSGMSIGIDEEDEEQKHESQSERIATRKKAQRVDDERESDGFMMFLPETMMSIVERVNVDRTEDDSFDEDAAFNADELDEITLGKKRNGLAARLKIDLDMKADELDDFAVGSGTFLREWNYKTGSYLENYCLLQPYYAPNTPATELPERIAPMAKKIKRQFSVFELERIRQLRVSAGQELNLDAWIDFMTLQNKSMHTQNFYDRIERKQRDLSTLILADISLSTEAGLDTETRIIDVIQDTLMVFAEALESIGDRFGMYAFSSKRNKEVRYHVLKNFNEPYGDRARGRIANIKPGYYTRLGAAIRQSSKVLSKQKSAKKLLLIISDGKPNDIDRYEGRYGVEDTKKAIFEARRQGIIPFCITIDQESNSYLPYIFGHNGFSFIKHAGKLPSVLPEIYLNLTH